MKAMILAVFTIFSLAAAPVHAQAIHQPAPALQTFDADWANG